jgi:hypothetical protein
LPGKSEKTFEMTFFFRYAHYALGWLVIWEGSERREN